MPIFNNQMFFLGQFADVDPTEGGTNSENAAALLGTYSKPPLTNIAVNDVDGDGAIMDNEAGATSDNFTYDTGAGTTSQILDSTQTYIARVQLGDGTFSDIEVLVIQMVNGDVFLTELLNNGSLDNLSIQNIELTSVTGSDYNGMFANQSVDNSSVVCFTAGAIIDTEHGRVPVENLRPGHLVRTLDHGYQPVRWVGYRTVEARELAENPHIRPIIIRKGALGNIRRMRVSPQHGFLVNDRLVRAKHLAQYFGGKVARLDSKTDLVTYVHFLCDKHEIVFADGSAAESLYLRPLALETIGRKATIELSTLFPELFKAMRNPEAIKSVYGPPARTYMTGQEVRRWKHSKRQKKEFGAHPEDQFTSFYPDIFYREAIFAGEQ